MKKMMALLIGLVTGFANGLFGSGGGTIAVPAMEKLLKTKTHMAHATAIAIILPLSVLSALIYWSDKTDWMAVLLVSTGGVAGGLTGSRLLYKLSSVWLNRIFGGFMIIAAIRMFF